MTAAYTPTGMDLREWTAATVGPEGAPVGEWTSVEVPGSPARFAGEETVLYRTTFDDPRDGDRALLTLRGLYAHARVWLNGEFLGEHDTYFTPFRAAFDPLETNELLVECRAPEDRLGGVFETDHVPPEQCVPGIWWGSTVEPVPENVITDLTVRPSETDAGGGVDAIVTVDAGTDLDGRIALSLGPTESAGASALSQVGVAAAAGERVTVQGRLSVRDPERWWPRGFGSPTRYTVRASLDEHERTTTTGFRRVEYGSDGLSVNGTPVPVRGMVSRPSDGGRDATVVEQALEANANLIRPHGHVPSSAVYDAADEAGVLVWQDVPLNPGALDVERVRGVARALGGEYDHRPSLAAFAVSDDAYRFEAVTDEGDRHALRATGEGERAATATAAAATLPDALPVFPVTDAPDELTLPEAWVLDGYAGTDREFDAGAHTRYVFPGADAETADRAVRAIEELRQSGRPLLTVRAPSDAAEPAEAIAAAFEPVSALLAEEATSGGPSSDEGAPVVVVNDTAESVVGDLEWVAGVEDGTMPVEVGPYSREVVGAISVLPDAPRIELSVRFDDRVISRTYER